MNNNHYNEAYAMLQYLSGEVINNMQRIILKTEPENKYAIKRVVTNNLQVKIALFNIETEKGTYKAYSGVEFANICSDVIVMQNTFTKLTHDMLETLNTN